MSFFKICPFPKPHIEIVHMYDYENSVIQQFNPHCTPAFTGHTKFLFKMFFEAYFGRLFYVQSNHPRLGVNEPCGVQFNQTSFAAVFFLK